MLAQSFEPLSAVSSCLSPSSPEPPAHPDGVTSQSSTNSPSVTHRSVRAARCSLTQCFQTQILHCIKTPTTFPKPVNTHLWLLLHPGIACNSYLHCVAVPRKEGSSTSCQHSTQDKAGLTVSDSTALTQKLLPAPLPQLSHHQALGEGQQQPLQPRLLDALPTAPTPAAAAQSSLCPAQLPKARSDQTHLRLCLIQTQAATQRHLGRVWSLLSLRQAYLSHCPLEDPASNLISQSTFQINSLIGVSGCA